MFCILVQNHSRTLLVPGIQSGIKDTVEQILAQGPQKYKSPVWLRPGSSEVHKTTLWRSSRFPLQALPALALPISLVLSHLPCSHPVVKGIWGTIIATGSPSLQDDTILFHKWNSRILTFKKVRFCFSSVFKFGKDVKLHFLGFLASILVLQERE